MARHYCNNKVANQAANKFDSIHFKMACFDGLCYYGGTAE